MVIKRSLLQPTKVTGLADSLHDHYKKMYCSGTFSMLMLWTAITLLPSLVNHNTKPIPEQPGMWELSSRWCANGSLMKSCVNYDQTYLPTLPTTFDSCVWELLHPNACRVINLMSKIAFKCMLNLTPNTASMSPSCPCPYLGSRRNSQSCNSH